MTEIAASVESQPVPASPSTPAGTPSATAGTLNVAMWAVGLALAALVAWTSLEYFPVQFALPAERSWEGLGEVPDPEAMVVQAKVEWRSAIIYLTLAGACFGLFPALFAAGGGPRRAIPVALVGLLVGAVCGAAAGASAAGLPDNLFPADGSGVFGGPETMLDDVVNYAVASILLALPAGVVFLMRPVPQAKQKFFAVPLGGLVAGMLVPVLASYVLPRAHTESVPSGNPLFNALWFGMIAVMVFLLTVVTGERRSRRGTVADAAV